MSGIWPGDTQCVAMLGFDVDGVSSWLNRDPNFINHPSLMSMAEYGPAVATPRILDMLDAHNVPASFYVPGYVAENSPRPGEGNRRQGAGSRPPRLYARAALHPHPRAGGRRP